MLLQTKIKNKLKIKFDNEIKLNKNENGWDEISDRDRCRLNTSF